MSIYATWLEFSEDTDDPDNPGAPYRYRGSHILPAADDERCGWLQIAGIPAYCGDGGLVDFLRLSTSDTDDGDPTVDVLLDRVQVTALRDRLTEWLNREREEG